MKEKVGHLSPFGLRMPDRVKSWVAEQARTQDRSMNYVILSILSERMQAATGAGFADTTPAAAHSHSDALQGAGQFHT